PFEAPAATWAAHHAHCNGSAGGLGPRLRRRSDDAQSAGESPRNLRVVGVRRAAPFRRRPVSKRNLRADLRLKSNSVEAPKRAVFLEVREPKQQALNKVVHPRTGAE